MPQHNHEEHFRRMETYGFDDAFEQHLITTPVKPEPASQRRYIDTSRALVNIRSEQILKSQMGEEAYHYYQRSQTKRQESQIEESP